MLRCFNFHSRSLGVQAMKESEHRIYGITMDQKVNRGKAVYHSYFYRSYKAVTYPGKEEGRVIGHNWSSYERIMRDEQAREDQEKGWSV